ncbi:MAG: hypothetical protein VYE68_05195 [Acidobacteriota bacterium]|nr:hypothetical protein [Acidobacteriota bacterium]
MTEISTAIAKRQDEIERLQAEIDALSQAGKLLGRSVRVKRVPAGKDAAAASAPRRQRRKMSRAEKKVVSERMKAYWAKRRKKTAKKAAK